MNYLNIVRPLNLLLLAIVQLLIKFSLLPMLEVDTALSNFNFFLLIAATILIAAGGNVINDIYDVSIDQINKPQKLIVGKHISEKNANTYYMLLTFIGVAIGFYVSNSISKPGFAAIFIGVSALLYMYASYLKSMLLISNILISFLVAMSMILIILLDIFPAIHPEKTELSLKASSIILQYAVFAFYFNFIREIVKDLQDINGDKNGGMNTLPILIGRKRTLNIVIALSIFGMTAVLYYIYVLFYLSQLTLIYFLLALVAPILFFISKAWSAKTKEDFGLLSLLLKIILLLGVLSIATLNYIPL